MFEWWALLAACSGDPREEGRGQPDVTITVTTNAPLATISERYLSFAVDTAQVVGGEFWNPDETSSEPEVSVQPFDFASPRLRTLTRALAPATLRIGGTAADFVYYDLNGETEGVPPEGYSLVMTEAQWAGVVDFAQDLDLDLLFTLNAGPGPRTGTNDNAWQPDNARDLMTYATTRGAPVTVWELGNEINAFLVMHGFTLSPEAYTADLDTLRALRDELDPTAAVAGPSSAFWPLTGDFNGFYETFMPVGGDRLDVVTWHYYPQQSQRCPIASRPAELETMLATENLDEVLVWADLVESAAGGSPVWLGETGNAQCGGQPGVSDRFVGGFWWLDQLGILAQRGQQRVVRQTLAGSDYGLLDDVNFAPYPDYWTSALWRRLMGAVVLDTESSAPHARAYAHCHPEAGVTVAIVNLLEEEQDIITDVEGPAVAYVLSAEALDSDIVLLNDAPLQLTEDDQLPSLEGVAVDDGLIPFPATSYGFVHFPEARCPQ